MTENFRNFLDKFKVEETTIFESEYWRWTLRLSQPTLGCGVLSLKRAAEKMMDLTTDEGSDLIKIIKVIEKTLYKAFPVKKMNYIMYMMVDFHVHYHIIPRYDETQTFDAVQFVDKGWPKPPVLDAEEVSWETLIQLKNYIKSQID